MNGILICQVSPTCQVSLTWPSKTYLASLIRDRRLVSWQKLYVDLKPTLFHNKESHVCRTHIIVLMFTIHHRLSTTVTNKKKLLYLQRLSMKCLNRYRIQKAETQITCSADSFDRSFDGIFLLWLWMI